MNLFIIRGKCRYNVMSK